MFRNKSITGKERNRFTFERLILRIISFYHISSYVVLFIIKFLSLLSNIYIISFLLAGLQTTVTRALLRREACQVFMSKFRLLQLTISTISPSWYKKKLNMKLVYFESVPSNSLTSSVRLAQIHSTLKHNT